MTAQELDRLIEQLRAADRASEMGKPELARLLTTLVRATMTRAGLRYADVRQARVIDRAISHVIDSGLTCAPTWRCSTCRGRCSRLRRMHREAD